MMTDTGWSFSNVGAYHCLTASSAAASLLAIDGGSWLPLRVHQADDHPTITTPCIFSDWAGRINRANVCQLRWLLDRAADSNQLPCGSMVEVSARDEVMVEDETTSAG
jgi:hypothetical protein